MVNSSVVTRLVGLIFGQVGHNLLKVHNSYIQRLPSNDDILYTLVTHKLRAGTHKRKEKSPIMA